MCREEKLFHINQNFKRLSPTFHMFLPDDDNQALKMYSSFTRKQIMF
jgi:hypothetical protein